MAKRRQLRFPRRLRQEMTDLGWQLRVAECGGRCQACGATENLTRDHIVPRSRGGSSALGNLQPLYWACNQRKRDMLPEEWQRLIECAVPQGLTPPATA